MKSLIISAIFVLASNSSYAAGAVKALNDVLAPGEYHGLNLAGDCKVTIQEVNFPESALNVIVSDQFVTMSKLITDDSIFAYSTKNKIYYQSDRHNIDEQGDFVEQYLKISNGPKRNVRIGEITVIEQTYNEKNIECNLSK